MVKIKKSVKKKIDKKKVSDRLKSYLKSRNYSCLYYNMYQEFSEKELALLPPPNYVLSAENLDEDWDGSVLFIGGKLNEKKNNNIKKIYEKMSSPKWVVVFGSIAMSGGISGQDGFGVKEITNIVKVDFFVPGNPCDKNKIKTTLNQLEKRIQHETYLSKK